MSTSVSMELQRATWRVSIHLDILWETKHGYIGVFEYIVIVSNVIVFAFQQYNGTQSGIVLRRTTRLIMKQKCDLGRWG